MHSALHFVVARSDRYFCFNLPVIIDKLFGQFRGLFRGNIDEEKSLPLVAIQPG